MDRYGRETRVARHTLDLATFHATLGFFACVFFFVAQRKILRVPPDARQPGKSPFLLPHEPTFIDELALLLPFDTECFEREGITLSAAEPSTRFALAIWNRAVGF